MKARQIIAEARLRRAKLVIKPPAKKGLATDKKKCQNATMKGGD
jgi:hypothetical protein